MSKYHAQHGYDNIVTKASINIAVNNHPITKAGKKIDKNSDEQPNKKADC